MKHLIEMIKDYKKSRSNLIFENIIKTVKHIIGSKLNTINYEDKDDIEQELLMLISKICIEKEILDNVLIDRSKFNYNNLILIKTNTNINLNELLELEMVETFLKEEVESKEIFLSIFTNIEMLDIFIKDYTNFVAGKKFLKLISIAIEREVINYKRKLFNNSKVTSIGIYDIDKIDQMNYYVNDLNFKEKKVKIEDFDLTNEEKEFLNLFIDGNKLLTENEVSKKLNISQQAVNKRKNKMKRENSK